MRKLCSVLALALLAGATPACEDDPVTATDLIVIQLSGIKEGDIAGGVVTKAKNVTTESGNPYGAFLQEAERLLGRLPSKIRVTSAQITLDGTSRGVASFQDLFTGETQVYLDADVGGTVYVAGVTDPSGTGPVSLEVIADDDELAPILAALLDGSFRVGIRGTTPRLPADDFDARVDIRIGFAAYE